MNPPAELRHLSDVHANGTVTSRARAQVEQVPKMAEGSRTTTEVPGTNQKSVEQTDVLIPATPITPTYKEGEPRGPTLPVQYRSVPLGTSEYERVPERTTELPAGTDDFTQDEVDLLGSKGVVSARWFVPKSTFALEYIYLNS